MIEIEHLTKTYSLPGKQKIDAIDDLSLRIAEGEFVVVTGRSGSGKSTLLNLMGGLAKPTAGSVLFAGKDWWKLDDEDRSTLRNLNIGFVFQFPSLLPALTILDNVILPATLNNSKLDTKDIIAKAKELLAVVGIPEKAQVRPYQLSMGQQQRAVIARALIQSPDLILADEPTSNLDDKTEQEIIDLFHQVHSSRGVTIVMVTHAESLVPHGTRQLRLSQGKLLIDSALGQSDSREVTYETKQK